MTLEDDMRELRAAWADLKREVLGLLSMFWLGTALVVSSAALAVVFAGHLAGWWVLEAHPPLSRFGAAVWLVVAVMGLATGVVSVRHGAKEDDGG